MSIATLHGGAGIEGEGWARAVERAARAAARAARAAARAARAAATMAQAVATARAPFSRPFTLFRAFQHNVEAQRTGPFC